MNTLPISEPRGPRRAERRKHSDSGGVQSDGSEFLALGEASMILAVALLVLASFVPNAVEHVRTPEPLPALEIKSVKGSTPSDSHAEQSGIVSQPSHRLTGDLQTLSEDATGDMIVAVPPEIFAALQRATSIKITTETHN